MVKAVNMFYRFNKSAWKLVSFKKSRTAGFDIMFLLCLSVVENLKLHFYWQLDINALETSIFYATF